MTTYLQQGKHLPYTEWPKKAIEWIQERKLFNLEERQFYDFHKSDLVKGIYHHFGYQNPRMPDTIKLYDNRLCFDWSHSKIGPFKNSDNLRWIQFYHNGNVMIEWKLNTNGIKLVSLDDKIYYRVNNMYVNEEAYAKYHLMIHLEEFKAPTEHQLIRKWLYDEPLIGDENL